MSDQSLIHIIEHSSCLVIKVGSNILLEKEGLNLPFLYTLAEDVHELRQAGKKVVIVTSGSIATAMAKLATSARPKNLPMKQAYAAIGQMGLMWEYERAFRVYDVPVAQVLLTRGDLENRKRYLNSHNTFMALFELNVIPIVNENDTVATDEIRFGDNDSLSAMVAGVINADVNIILSDIDGLYTANPQLDPNARHLPLVTSIGDDLERMAGNSLSGVGTGGMITKIQAAKICMNAGIPMVIGCGRGNHALRKLIRGKTHGTLFTPGIDALSARKRWILPLQSRGQLVIDSGAQRAVQQKDASLLPIGVIEVRGAFERGDCVDIISPNGAMVAKGLVFYSSSEIKRIKGKKSTEIEYILGYTNHDDLVHRDNMAVYNSDPKGEHL